MKQIFPPLVLRTFLLISCVATPWVARADLSWSNPDQRFTATAGQKLIEAKYQFTNKGDKPATITGVKTSCGCTTAALKKMEYMPGESGEIDVTFHIEGRTGEQEKTIMVTTTESPNKPTFLQLDVNIPRVLVIEPQFVFWTVGEKMQSKTLHLKIGKEYPAKIVSVETDSPEITIETHEITPGKEMEIKVTPKDLTRPSGTTILIKTDYPPENPQTHYAYARVKG